MLECHDKEDNILNIVIIGLSPSYSTSGFHNVQTLVDRTYSLLNDLLSFHIMLRCCDISEILLNAVLDPTRSLIIRGKKL